jgi:TonB-linked SusC/RagA family outer membrane protein
MYAFLLLFLLHLSHPFRAVASPVIDVDHMQAIRVRGIVKNTQGDVMPGVNVLVKGTTIGTSSDANGEFSLEVNGENDVLVFSFIGYKVFEMRVGAQTEISVSLAEDATSLDAVEIRSTGYWSDTKARSIGNIAKISSEDIERQPVTSPLMSLQGRMAGVDIQPTAGMPGSAVKIQIRGQNSLRLDGNYPLYVIDGIPVDSHPLEPAANSLLGAFDPLSTINPANIESIQVLKDADATSIYGSRGANGVILITTKQAGKSGKTSVEVSCYRGVGRVSKFLDMMNTQQYLAVRREAFRNDGIEPPSYEYDLTTWDTTRYTDWQKTLIGGTADISDVQTGISGGNANTSFRLGGGYHKETLVFPGDFGYRRLAGSFNMNHLSPSQKLRLSLAINYGSEKNKLFDDTYMMRNALTLQPNAPALYMDDGELNWENSTFQNPLATTRNVHNANTDNLLTNVDVIYNIIRGLDLKVNAGYTTLNGIESVILPLAAINPEYVRYYTGAMREGTNTRKTWIVEPQMNYNAHIGGSELNVVVGGTWQEGRLASKMVEYSGYESDALIGTLGNARINIVRDENNEYKYIAMYARMGYNWKERYFINLTGRRDGSSRYSPENQFGNFGSVGAAWIFTEEPFLNRLKPFLNFGKLRSSYGSTGSDQIGDYKYIGTYMATGKYQGAASLYPTGLYNPDYQWEVTHKFEAAIETKFWNSRVSLEAAYYQNRSSNQLINIALPYATGFGFYFGNFNPLIENRGWEFNLSTENIRSENFRWTTNINLTRPRNELVSFPGLEKSAYRSDYVVGKPITITKLYTYQGINPETGRYEVADENNDGLFDFRDRQYVHNFGRQYYGGMNNTITFRNFELSFLLQYANQTARTYLGQTPGNSYNQQVGLLDRWRQPGDVTKYQLYTAQGYGLAVDRFYNYSDSNAAIEDASFFRLKTLTFAYTVPVASLRRTKLSMAKVYMQGQNLFTITDYYGLDPETGAMLPPLQVFTLGVQIKL